MRVIDRLLARDEIDALELEVMHARRDGRLDENLLSARLARIAAIEARLREARAEHRNRAPRTLVES